MYVYFQYLLIILQSSLLMSAAGADVTSRSIPNSVCLALAVTGSALQILISPLLLAETWALTIPLFAALLFLHSRAMLGGGDVKLLLATACGLPPYSLIDLFAVTALAGGVLALVHLTMRHLPRPRVPAAKALLLRRIYSVERWRILRHAPLPYGVAIACGGIWAALTATHTGG
jgi:prepilin peptidase CpaA